MNVTEGSGKEIGSSGAVTKRIDDGGEVVLVGVELGAVLSLHTVFFAAHNTNLDFEKLVVSGGLGVEFLSNFHVFGHGDSGAVPHVGLEEGIFATLYALSGYCQEGTNETVKSVLGAVIGV